MKKKMTILAVLVAAVAITTSQVAGTYAKYTYTAGGTDKARVAKWKINEIKKFDLFNNSYTHVKAGSDDEAIIAPGTSGEYKFTITGEVETDYTLKVNVEATDGINSATYAPISYKYDNEVITDLDANGHVDALDLVKKINDQYAAEADTTKAAGTITDTEHTISWEWKYDNSQDENDSKLGTDAASSDKKVEITVNISVEQVNPATE